MEIYWPSEAHLATPVNAIMQTLLLRHVVAELSSQGERGLRANVRNLRHVKISSKPTMSISGRRAYRANERGLFEEAPPVPVLLKP